ncbi:MAG: hypothetical protein KF767_00145 [Bdellovibrionaceae bacterium]|nr:hypothetical protein [Pseudobdellovibrionaceae bacterium]
MTKRSSQSGSVMVLMLVVAAVIGIIAYVVSNLVSQVLNSLSDEDIQLEAQMLASDLREHTKYMLSYDKVTFINAPLQIDSSRRDSILQLWKDSPSQSNFANVMNVTNVCGGYDTLANFLGTLSINGEPVFCPVMVRQPQMTTKLIQDMYLKQWSRADRNAQIWNIDQFKKETMADVFVTNDADGNPLPPGMFRMVYKYSKKASGGGEDLDWFINPQNSIPIYLGQRLLELGQDRNSGFEIKASVTVDFFTDDMGFVGKLSERFYKIRSEVELKKGAESKRFVDTESFALRTPTQKDFSLFVLFPVDNSTPAQPTDSFKKSMRIHPSSNIRGRVYFNGNIDVDSLSDLPNFHDTVFISGSILTKFTNNDLQLFRTKFRRGLVTNLSAGRYLFDGTCLSVRKPDPFDQLITNGTMIQCKNMSTGEFGIEAYPAYVGDPCRCFPRIKKQAGTVNNFNWQYGPKPAASTCPTAETPENCNNMIRNNQGFFQIHAAEELEVSQQVLSSKNANDFLLGAYKKMIIKDSPFIYGSMLVSHIEALQPFDMFALQEAKAGSRGIGSAQDLTDMSGEANGNAFGVQAPLMNMPLIQLAKDTFK